MLELKRLKSELLRCGAAKAELEYMIAQKQDEIQRMQDTIAKQETHEIELTKKIKELGE